MNKNQIVPIVIIVCGALLVMCGACYALASEYFYQYFQWLDRFLR